MEDRLTNDTVVLNTFLTYYQSPVGLVRIAGTEHFISEIHFMKEEDMVSAPAATIPLPGMAIQAVEQLIEYFNGNRRVFELPIAQEGTVFQQKVWAELMHIPFGKTISYMDLSKRLGDPKVIRAAAAANGKNNIAIVVPCHRVIGSNRELVGYAGGIKRKKWLLEHEKKIAYGIQTLF
jgi:methylated-DNA-[protein]-cysteine S-methyltransferase